MLALAQLFWRAGRFCVFPGSARLLVRETRGELFRSEEPFLRDVRLFLEALLVRLRLRQLRLQRRDVVAHRLQLRLFGGEDCVCVRELPLGRGERLPLGLHHLGHAVVDAHGVRPHAERHGRARLPRHRLRLVLRVLDVLVQQLRHLWPDVVLVEVEQALHEPAVGEHPLRSVPVGFFPEEEAHRLHCHLDERRRLGERLDLRDVVLVEAVERRDGGLERGEGLVQVRLGVVGDGLGLHCLLLHDRFVRGHARRHDLRRGLVLLHLLQQNRSRRALLRDDRSERPEFHLHRRDYGVGLLQLVEAVQEAFAGHAELLAAVGEEGGVEGDQV